MDRKNKLVNESHQQSSLFHKALYKDVQPFVKALLERDSLKLTQNDFWLFVKAPEHTSKKNIDPTSIYNRKNRVHILKKITSKISQEITLETIPSIENIPVDLVLAFLEEPKFKITLDNFFEFIKAVVDKNPRLSIYNKKNRVAVFAKMVEKLTYEELTSENDSMSTFKIRGNRHEVTQNAMGYLKSRKTGKENYEDLIKVLNKEIEKKKPAAE